jgi:hypothetical protein
VATVTVLKALDLADQFRQGRETCRPIQLWRLADEETGGVRAARVLVFRHSMIHAGYAVTAKGGPYKRCPMCHSALR